MGALGTINKTTSVIESSEKGAVNGVASLDGSGQVPLSQLGNVGSTAQAGSKAFGDFALSGGLMKATVTLPTAYVDTNYVPMPIGLGSSNYNITVESLTTTTFVINLNSAVAPTEDILWTTTKY